MTPKPSKISNRTWLIRKIVLVFGLMLLLGAAGYFGYQMHLLSDRQEQLKKDYAEMNNISLGLFSIDQWDEKIEAIINRQVRNFKITPEQRRVLQKEIEQVIIALIDKAEALVTEPEKKSLRGKIIKFAVKNFVDTDTIKKEVPAMAKTILNKIDNPTNKRQLSSLALRKLSELEESDKIDSMLTVSALTIRKTYQKYNVKTAEQFNAKIGSELKKIRTQTVTYSIAMLISITIVLTLWWIFRNTKALHPTLFIMSLLFAFMLLAVGLTASMIEVDARINSLNFVLLGQDIYFDDQVLFFESKSILDVVIVLIGSTAIDSIAVGVLILAFSILFPVMKLSSTGVHLLGRKKLAENKIIKYFAFQSGKWSMADVVVIAILMAYIGLNGLLESQLGKFNIPSDNLTLLSTHNTSLQPGYIIFIAFVLFGLILSTILKFITPHNAD